VTITVDYATVAEAEKVFAALSEGGQVTMPMQAAFWAKRWGMVVDKFGTPWNVNGEQIPV
jgi:PhnB protein